jgi:hypothetical protein
MTPKSWPLPFYTGRWQCERYKNPITGAQTKHTFDAKFFGHPNLVKAMRWLEKHGYEYIVRDIVDPQGPTFYTISFWQNI